MDPLPNDHSGWRRVVVVLATSAFLALAAAAAALPADPARRQPASVLQSDVSRVVFRVDIDNPTVEPSEVLPGATRIKLLGYGARGVAGEPQTVSRAFHVGLPPEGGFHVSFRVLETQHLGNIRIEPNPSYERAIDDDLGILPIPVYRIDEERYAAYQSPPLVEAGDPAFVRRNRVLPLTVNPVTYDPASGSAVLATSIEVTVTFAGRPAGDARSARDHAMWDRIMGHLLVNAGQARSWRVPSALRDAAPVRTPAAAAQPTLVKLLVEDTGMYRVRASTLVAAGFTANPSVSSLHLFQRTYDDVTLQPGTVDIAYYVKEDDAGTSGVFEGNDLIMFYGRNLRDDVDQGDRVMKYSEYNIYWLGTTSGPAMVEHTLGVGFITADTASTSFPVSDHFEEDVIFREKTPTGMQDVYVYNLGTEPQFVNFGFNMKTPVTGSTVTLTSQLNGIKESGLRGVDIFVVNSLGTTPLGTRFASGMSPIAVTTDAPASAFVTGSNTYRFAKPPSDPRGNLELMLNWLDVSYPARYRAANNELRFNTGSLAGDTSIVVTNLETNSHWMFDVTDPLTPIRCIAPAALYADAGGSYVLAFRDNLPGRKEYTILPGSAMTELDASRIVRDTFSTIIGGEYESGVDVLLVIHQSLMATMQQWVDYRQSQGYRVFMVDETEIHDEFNNGVRGVRGIDRFVRHFYERAGASALVIVGDSSEDARAKFADSPPDYVPTHMFGESIPVINDKEVVTSDKQFVLLPGPGGATDNFPDMVVGRIPAASAGELQIVLFKTFDFESVEPGEDWRKRVILVADDRYSEGNGSVFGGGTFEPIQTEVRFQRSQEDCQAIIENSWPGGFDVVTVYQGDWSEGFYQGQPKNKTEAITFVRNNVTTVLMSELDKGAMLVTIQAHMNRYLVAHEKMFVTQTGTLVGGPGTGKDHKRVRNDGKPWIIFGMGCHFSDYALFKEMSSINRTNNNNPNGDAFAEQLLFQNNRGAVATYGSTGYEFLGQVNSFMETTTAMWFYAAPFDNVIDQTEGEWIFGELMFIVEQQMAGLQAQPVKRYHILGDPLLHIDAGEPTFDVTVNGEPFQSGDPIVAGGVGDLVAIEATVTDENVVHGFELKVGGVDATDSLVVTRLSDLGLAQSRQLRASFNHRLRAETYDIVLTSLQMPDSGGLYHRRADFVLRVETSIEVTANGRPLPRSGAQVPAKANYHVELGLPVFVPESQIGVHVDGDSLTNIDLFHPTPEDSTTWLIDFSLDLPDGQHELVIRAGGFEDTYTLQVSSEPGLREVLNYPNPFSADGTYFMFKADLVIDEGRIDIYTVSGKRIRRVSIPPMVTQPGQNAVFWDGRDMAGDEIANGVYLYIITVEQAGKQSTVQGKLARAR